MRRLLLVMAAVVLAACNGRSIVFQAPAASSACPTAPYTVDPEVGSAGDLELTSFDVEVGSGSPLTPSETDEVVVVGTNGNLWFRGTAGTRADRIINVIDRVTSDGCLSEYRFELANGLSGRGLAASPDGHLWFTADDEIVRFAPSGAINEFLLADANEQPLHADAISLGSDGYIWFTESAGTGETRMVRVSGVREQDR